MPPSASRRIPATLSRALATSLLCTAGTMLVVPTLPAQGTSATSPAAQAGIMPEPPASHPPSLMPLPASMAAHDGLLRMDGSFGVRMEGYREARLDRAAGRLLHQLTAQTGIPFFPDAPGQHALLTLHTTGASKPVQELGEDESYQLEITTTGATLTAPNPLGILRGLATFVQLVHATPTGFAADAVSINDKPRFPWRGLMLDSSRHFMPMPKVLETLDGMEAVKLNVLHWHLSDDQGFRVESLRYPKLQGMGSDGRFYTQQQIRDTITYARDRGIRVIPEFDMPGHSRSWFPGYPELAAGPGPYTIMHVYDAAEAKAPDLRRDPAMDPTKDEVYRFLNGFIAEMAALFPDRYFHVGGDEVDGKQWDANAHIQSFMKAHNMENDAALQAYFTARVQKLVTAHGKVTIGWDEVLQPGTPKDVVIQSWRGQRSLFQAASQGNRGILSAGYYIDLNQPASQHYLVDPLVLPPPGPDDPTAKGMRIPDQLTPDQEKLILGGEATEWTEFITPEILSNRIWPRSAAIAERFWSPQATRDVPSMYARLGWISHQLSMAGLATGGVQAGMLERLAASTATDRLMVLATMVQPPLDYNREAVETYDETNPLIHLVDAVPAESEIARHFAELAHGIATGTASPAQHAEARSWLSLWAANDTALAPTLSATPLSAELVPLSRNLSRTATIGLIALNRLESHGGGHAGTVTAEQSELKAMEPLVAVLRNMAVAPVEELVAAAPPGMH